MIGGEVVGHGGEKMEFGQRKYNLYKKKKKRIFKIGKNRALINWPTSSE